MRRMRMVALGMVLAVVAAPGVAAQKPIELGLDAGIAIQLEDPGFVTVGVPIQAFRIGFFTSDAVSIEPRFSWTYLKPEGQDGTHLLDGELGVPVHLSPPSAESRVYLRPFGGISLISSGGSASQAHLGAGIGLKIPAGVEHLKFRLEAGYRHGFENDDYPTASTIYFQIGLSFLNR